MAIPGQYNIDIGAENQSANSDNLYEAFTKIQDNFTTLFDNASPYNTFVGGPGISVDANSAAGRLTITNTGVVSLVEGTGIVLSSSNGNVVISSTGSNVGSGGTVTSVNISSSTLNVGGGPIVSSGSLSVNLPQIPPSGSFAAGEYVAPTLTVDNYGRITEIANTVGVGTVTSVAITAVGAGLSVANSPITSSGAIAITNTGVTSITAGTNIVISGSTGNVTIDADFSDVGTVTRIDINSNSLVVTGSPVTTSGNVTIEIPNDITLTGNLVANTITANLGIETDDIVVTGTANIATANVSALSGNVTGNFNGIIGGVTPNAATFTNATFSGNANVSGRVNTSILNIRNNSSNLNFITTAGNNVSFVTPTSASDASFYVPNSVGTVYQVMGITANAAVQTLGWKTIPVQYLTITLRNSSTVLAPPDVVQRQYKLETRSGSFIDISLS